jgi:hypothetical protein
MKLPTIMPAYSLYPSQPSSFRTRATQEYILGGPRRTLYTSIASVQSNFIVKLRTGNRFLAKATNQRTARSLFSSLKIGGD